LIKKTEKGFAMVLSLVLLLAMSLMGGALILIASGDHQSNNDSDQYQQTFYAAEMGLLAGESYILNEKYGPWDSTSNARDESKSNNPEANMTSANPPQPILFKPGKINKDYKNYVKDAPYDYWISDTKKVEKYYLDTSDTCFKSFKDIDEDKFHTIKDSSNKSVAYSYNLGVLLEKTFTITGTDQEKKEATKMKKFYYEYFIEFAGTSSLNTTGGKIGESSTDNSNNGFAYRIYSCGIYGEKDDANKMVVSLESILVIPRN
jgi:hypothetical protein